MRFSFSRALIYTIDFVLGIAELFIVARIILKLFGANPQAPFVIWVYEISKSLISPFLGMFPSPVLEGGFVIEFSAIFALIVYAVVGYLIIELLEYVSYHAPSYRVVKSTEVRG